MKNKPANEDQTDQPKPQYMSSKPPIFYLYEFLQQRPLLLGTIAGAFVGLVIATQIDIRLDISIIGGAILGTVLAGIILRLRS